LARGFLPRGFGALFLARCFWRALFGAQCRADKNFSLNRAKPLKKTPFAL
jgi:hypothetical protein